MAERIQVPPFPKVRGKTKEDDEYYEQLYSQKQASYKKYENRAEIKILQQWAEYQYHLPKLTAEIITPFLVAENFNVEQAKYRLDMFFTVRTHTPEVFKNRNVRRLCAECLGSVLELSPLPHDKPTDDGCRVIFSRLKDTSVEKYDFIDCMQSCVLAFDAEGITSVIPSGIIVVFDMKGWTLSHLPYKHLAVVRKIFTFIQEAVPLKIRGVHHLNVPPTVSYLINFLKPFLNAELRQQLHYYKTSEFDEFLKCVPKKCLPSDYGGDLDSMEVYSNRLRRLLLDEEEWMGTFDKFTVNERKRPGKAKSSSDLFGVEGSFKKLEID